MTVAPETMEKLEREREPGESYGQVLDKWAKERTETMYKNINKNFGDPVTFDSLEEMADAIKKCGYELPADGLVEGRDYEIVTE